MSFVTFEFWSLISQYILLVIWYENITPVFLHCKLVFLRHLILARLFRTSSRPYFLWISQTVNDLYGSRLMTQILLKLILLKMVVVGGYVNGSPARGSQSDGDSTNTTVRGQTSYILLFLCFITNLCFLANNLSSQIFVGGLDPNVSDEDLRQPFLQYGEVVSVKIPVGKGCGFVQFANRCFCLSNNPMHCHLPNH